MQKLILRILLLFLSANGYAQPQDAARLHETAKTFMKQGDYSNAILVLQRCLQEDARNINYIKDLALSYFFKKDHQKALEVIKPVLDREDADDQCFQIAGYAYKELVQLKDCEKLYRKGIKKFPNSGALYCELGELLWAQQDYGAIREWEKGIEADPSYSRNYYHACRHYYLSTDKVWSLFYGEVFINMEPRNSNTPEIKNILLEGYKKLFTEIKPEAIRKMKPGFDRQFLQTMYDQTAIAAQGINPETLTMIRTRFIISWQEQKSYPHKLFEYQQQLLREGLFSAYNQWIFGPVQDLSAYQNWVNTHHEENEALGRFRQDKLFKVPPGQYLH